MRDLTLLSDQDLQRLAVSGDRAAEELLASRYMQLVRACARPLFLAGGDSEDLSQEGVDDNDECQDGKHEITASRFAVKQEGYQQEGSV